MPVQTLALFENSLEVLLSWEGGYSCDPRDPGGETYCGISRVKWPNWEGWKLLDGYKYKFPNSIIPWNTVLGYTDITNLVTSFYRTNFWNLQDFKDLTNQDVADKIFQHYVNLGDRAIKFVQENLYQLGYPCVKDGKMGLKTVEGINLWTISTLSKLGDIQKIEPDGDTLQFLESYCKLLWNDESPKDGYYTELIVEHPQFHVFTNEWKLRSLTIGKRP